jgi:acid phosphatase
MNRLVTLFLLGLLGCGVVDPAATRPLPAYTPGELAPGTATLRVIAMGDWGTGRSSQQVVADAMAQRAREAGADFVLTLGDNFYSSGVDSVDDSQWEEKFSSIYADPALAIPWQVSVGNHDHKGSIEAQIEYGRRPSSCSTPRLCSTIPSSSPGFRRAWLVARLTGASCVGTTRCGRTAASPSAARTSS